MRVKFIETTKAFHKDLERLSRGRYGSKIALWFDELLSIFESGDALPAKYRDHALVGNLAGYRDCHLKPDIVILYQLNNETLLLYRIGSHSELRL